EEALEFVVHGFHQIPYQRLIARAVGCRIDAEQAVPPQEQIESIRHVAEMDHGPVAMVIEPVLIQDDVQNDRRFGATAHHLNRGAKAMGVWNGSATSRCKLHLQGFAARISLREQIVETLRQMRYPSE
ncbi:MAG: hypothetical protein Q4Q58_07205, partial [Thermoplasmata archaeon]|nr:hypothetical protein [Thermoplasmata archaeon]